jgi:hypothetical protein
MEDVILVAPHRAHLILRPAALEVGDDLVLAALAGPAMGAEIMFEHVDRAARFALELEFVHVHHLASRPPWFNETARAQASAQETQVRRPQYVVDY